MGSALISLVWPLAGPLTTVIAINCERYSFQLWISISSSRDNERHDIWKASIIGARERRFSHASCGGSRRCAQMTLFYRGRSSEDAGPTPCPSGPHAKCYATD
ncbi:jg17733 [Pararge aegeria aegeria]|uniref:Jg17733 protein n=1 Tax=Pararge aegeria aegeria TaxID=348720 RepID=A0A8S4S4T6_9NEOP|nr:jg17733 [Pararge aegeria aegeria]